MRRKEDITHTNTHTLNGLAGNWREIGSTCRVNKKAVKLSSDFNITC